MKNLMVFASAVMVGAAVFAGTTPRVYEYSASLNTAVAKNASKVTYNKETMLDVCYRAKGKVNVKGVLALGCDCYMFEGPVTPTYPIVLMATSADKYSQVVFATANMWAANRLGNPISSKAKDAELGFQTTFQVGPTNDFCRRTFALWNAGFGSASVLDSGDKTLDIASISGNVTGYASAPFCNAVENTCPRCTGDDECQVAIAYMPCAFADPDDYETRNGGVAYGTFSLKFNSSLSKAIKPILPANIQGTINALVPKVFGSKAVAPVYVAPEEPEEP